MLADEQGLEDAQLANRVLEIPHVDVFDRRQLDVGDCDLPHRPQRGIPHKLFDVMPGVTHTEGWRESFASTRRWFVRLLLFELRYEKILRHEPMFMNRG
jgi:hypothetical protein